MHAFSISYGDQTISHESVLNQPVVAVMDSCNSLNMGLQFDAVALSENGEILYKLDYLMENHTVHVDLYRWCPA